MPDFYVSVTLKVKGVASLEVAVESVAEALTTIPPWISLVCEICPRPAQAPRGPKSRNGNPIGKFARSDAVDGFDFPTTGGCNELQEP